jgi:UDP-N-acetylglucosamine--N-acetylmuramyl-(pentapeptide) pyrophosphoryl-undecaprenol N-acetylglucosamine transferase
MKVLLLGGGTAGHVNPLIATAKELIANNSTVLCIGTKNGIESNLVPSANLNFKTITKAPLPRQIDKNLLTFPFKICKAYLQAKKILKEFNPDCIVSFGGYVAFPFLIKSKMGNKKNKSTKIVLHEANSVAGVANKWAAKNIKNVIVTTTFKHSTINKIKKSILIGMPVINNIKNDYLQNYKNKTLLVTGGSLGAENINTTIYKILNSLIDNKIKIIHITGKNKLPENIKQYTNSKYYKLIEYCTDMQKVYSKASLVLCRGGAGTVSELEICGLPSILVPLAHGNGEQKFNAQELIDNNATIVISDKDLTPELAKKTIIETINNFDKLKTMSKNAYSLCKLNATKKLVAIILDNKNYNN